MRLEPPTERRLFLVAMGLLAAATIVPFWSVEYLPLPDGAQHLTAVAVWHFHDQPSYDLARYYDLSLHANPYWAYYALLNWLTYPFGLDAANRAVLSLYAVALPLGVLYLARRFGRSPWLAVLAFPLVWNFNLRIGFTNFCLGLAALPFAVGLFDSFCERPTARRGAVAALFGTLLYFFHLLPWSMYLAASGLVGLLHHGRSLRRIAGRLAVWLVPVATGIVVTVRSSGLHVGAAASGGFSGSHVPIWQSIGELHEWVWSFCNGREDEVLALLLVAVWVALVLTAGRRKWTLHDLRPEACFLAAMVAYLVAPRSIHSPAYWWGVNIRYASMAVLFLVLCVPGEIAGWRRALIAAGGAVAIGFVVAIAIHWQRANRFVDAHGYDEIAALPPPGSRVLFIQAMPWHDESDRINYAQIFPEVYQAFHGGYMPWNFDDGFPLRYRVRYPAPPWNSPYFNWAQHARYYDYVITFQQPRPFPGHEREARLVHQAGKWALWKLPGPRIDESPGPVYPSGWASDPKWRPPAPK